MTAMLALPSVLRGQLVSSGFQVQNPNWEILITDYGYADLLLDRRPGFIGREFLSGEWAAAVLYAGGQNPTGPIWFQKQWFFPDWVSNSNFGVEQGFRTIGTNASLFRIYQSVITNRDLRITMTYEMLDSTNGIAQGTTRKSAGGAGSSVTSDRYVFRQTYRLTNISGSALTNVRLYQFMHGLETGTSVYDDRMYVGPMSTYRYDNTQQGQPFSFDSRSGEIVQHSDTIAFHSMLLPNAWEVGYFGKKGVDSHEVGKPSVGVHLSVEANSLNGTDFFDPPEDRWVSGAQRFDLGNLAAGASVTNDVLLTIQTSFVVRFAGVDIRILTARREGAKFILEFRELIGGPVGFILRKSTTLGTPPKEWTQLPIPSTIFPQTGMRRFEIPIEANETQAFYFLDPVIQQ
jgi:hypothetical protein